MENCDMEQYPGLRYGGYFMNMPTAEKAKHCLRELPFSERISVLSQGFHFGVEEIRCYDYRSLVFALGKREFNNPSGGVRFLEMDVILPWLKNVIEDDELAETVKVAYLNENSMAERMDTVRTVLYIRLRQYEAAIKNED